MSKRKCVVAFGALTLVSCAVSRGAEPGAKLICIGSNACGVGDEILLSRSRQGVEAAWHVHSLGPSGSADGSLTDAERSSLLQAADAETRHAEGGACGDARRRPFRLRIGAGGTLHPIGNAHKEVPGNVSATSLQALLDARLSRISSRPTDQRSGRCAYATIEMRFGEGAVATLEAKRAELYEEDESGVISQVVAAAQLACDNEAFFQPDGDKAATCGPPQTGFLASAGPSGVACPHTGIRIDIFAGDASSVSQGGVPLSGDTLSAGAMSLVLHRPYPILMQDLLVNPPDLPSW